MAELQRDFTAQGENQTANHSPVVTGDFAEPRELPCYQTGSTEQLLYVEIDSFGSGR